MTNHERGEQQQPLPPPPPAVPPHKDHLAHHSSIASGMDIDRKRLVESISDHLYGRGNLWTRDDDLSVVQSQCAGCRRTRYGIRTQQNSTFSRFRMLQGGRCTVH